MSRTSNPPRLHTEHLNTPRLVADDTQKTVWKWEQQEPFGAGACNPDPDGDNVQFEFNLRFPGQYFDRESNLHYNYLRDYDSGIGRYVQSDPLGMGGGINLFAYVRGMPLLLVDPSGELPQPGPVGTNIGSKLGNPNYTGSALDPVFIDTESNCELSCQVKVVAFGIGKDVGIHHGAHYVQHSVTNAAIGTTVARLSVVATAISVGLSIRDFLDCTEICRNKASCRAVK